MYTILNAHNNTPLHTQTHRQRLLVFNMHQNCNVNKNKRQKSKKLKRVCNEFIRCFHQFFSPIFSTDFSQFEQLKKNRKFLLVQNIFKLADRMRSMRTTGASKNPDWCNTNGGDFPHGQNS